MSTQTCPSKSGNEVVMAWNVHLAREYPAKLTCLISLIVFAALSALMIIGPPAMIAVAVIMTAGFADFLFPMRFIITGESATCKTLLKQSEIKWENVRRCYIDDLGVKLSPLNRISRLEAFRGVYLRFADNQETVVETVKSLRREVADARC